jgi:NodT family efflux transporter outer membrane factor (OMF) lipoprotein
MKTNLFVLTGTVLLSVLLCSCALFAPEPRQDLNRDIPNAFSLYSADVPDSTNQWWNNFHSSELNTLIHEALTNSPSIQQAWARLAQAEAFAIKVGASRYPSLGYDGGTSARKNSRDYETEKSYSLGLNASYELDLWGRIKSEAEAAALDRDASREQLNTVAISLSSQVALNWIGILSQRLQTEVIHRQLEANQTSLELIELRFRKSLSSALDVYQQRQTVAGTESRLPLAELREDLIFNGLAALLGYADFQSLEITQTDLPVLEKLPALGIPADVLANRPDVRQAGLRLQAADWNVSAARADRLPTFRLTASGEYASTEFSDLFDDWFASLVGSVTGPVFDGGSRKAEVARARAVADERLAAYRETVINAIKEVEDALISEQKQRDYITALDRRLAAARRSYEESINRYRNGLIEYTTVLIQLNPLQALELDRVEAQYNLLRYRIDLYRALGGSWPNDLTPALTEKTHA